METDKLSNDIVSRYRRYLKLEKGHSANTLDAYMRDLDKLLRYLAAEKIDVLKVKLEDLEFFAASISDLGIGPRSLARILSGCLLYTSPSPRDRSLSRMPSSA